MGCDSEVVAARLIFAGHAHRGRHRAAFGELFGSSGKPRLFLWIVLIWKLADWALSFFHPIRREGE
jgi:hypothetical protein